MALKPLIAGMAQSSAVITSFVRAAFVAATGSDTTGLVDRRDKPFATSNAAVSALNTAYPTGAKTLVMCSDLPTGQTFSGTMNDLWLVVAEARPVSAELFTTFAPSPSTSTHLYIDFHDVTIATMTLGDYTGNVRIRGDALITTLNRAAGKTLALTLDDHTQVTTLNFQGTNGSAGTAGSAGSSDNANGAAGADGDPPTNGGNGGTATGGNGGNATNGTSGTDAKAASIYLYKQAFVQTLNAYGGNGGAGGAGGIGGNADANGGNGGNATGTDQNGGDGGNGGTATAGNGGNGSNGGDGGDGAAITLTQQSEVGTIVAAKGTGGAAGAGGSEGTATASGGTGGNPTGAGAPGANGAAGTANAGAAGAAGAAGSNGTDGTVTLYATACVTDACDVVPSTHPPLFLNV